MQPSKWNTSAPQTRSISRLLPGLLLLFAGACSVDGPALVGPEKSVVENQAAARVHICHVADPAGASIISVSMNALPAHLAHGDYVSEYSVAKQNQPGDGIHFQRITNALDNVRSLRRDRGETRTAACRITIDVAADAFTGSFTTSSDTTLERLPLVFDVPLVTLHGALQMKSDAAGRPAGELLSDATSLGPNNPMLNNQALVLVIEAADGSTGTGTTIDGFDFLSGQPPSSTSNAGFGIVSMRVRDLTINNNRFATLLSSALDLRATSAGITNNYAERLGTACGFCIGGPGVLKIANNTVRNGGRVGILLTPVSTALPSGVMAYVPDEFDSIRAEISGNLVSGHDHHSAGLGTGIRIFTSGAPATQSAALIDFRNNDVLDNSFGVMIDGATPGPSTRGDAVVNFTGNTISGSCRSDLFVSFTGPNHALTAGNNTTGNYLRNSTYTIVRNGDVTDAHTLIDHPAGYANTLIIDGDTIANTAPLPPLDPHAPCWQ